jgi:hypothetical protein
MKLFTKNSYKIGTYGDYETEFSDEFEKLIESAKEKLLSFAEERINDVSETITYFIIDGCNYSEYDCCDNDKCKRAILKQIKKECPDTKIEVSYESYGSDKEQVESCVCCGRLLNDYLSWVKFELNHIEEYITDFSKEYFELYESDAALIYIVLDSVPSEDVKENLRSYKTEKEFFANREEFYQRIYKLVTKINKSL